MSEKEEHDRILKRVKHNMSLMATKDQLSIISGVLHNIVANSGGESVAMFHVEKGECPFGLVMTHGKKVAVLVAMWSNLMKESSKDDEITKLLGDTMKLVMTMPDPPKFFRTVLRKTLEQISGGARGAVYEHPDTHGSEFLLFAHTLNETHNLQWSDDDSKPGSEQQNRASGSSDRKPYTSEFDDTTGKYKRRGSDRPEHNPIPPKGPEVSEGAPPPPADQPDRSSESEGGKTEGTENPVNPPF